MKISWEKKFCWVFCSEGSRKIRQKSLSLMTGIHYSIKRNCLSQISNYKLEDWCIHYNACAEIEQMCQRSIGRTRKKLLRMCSYISSIDVYHNNPVQGGRSFAGHRGPPPKSLDLDKNFKPEHTLFCRELIFVAIYALFFGDLWA